MPPIALELVSPAHPAVSIAAEEVVLPGAAGVFTVQAGHTPLLTTLGFGPLIAYDAEDKPTFFAVHGGYAEILDDKVLVLADRMERREDIRLDRAKAAAERARDTLRKSVEEVDTERAEAALARARTRIQTHAGQEY